MLGSRREAADTEKSRAICSDHLRRGLFLLYFFSLHSTESSLRACATTAALLEREGHWFPLKMMFLWEDDKVVCGMAWGRACGDMQGHEACWDSVGLVGWARQIWHNLIHTVCKKRTLEQSLMPDFAWNLSHIRHSEITVGSNVADRVICSCGCSQVGFYLAILPAGFPRGLLLA